MPSGIGKCAHDIVNRFQEVLLALESESCSAPNHKRAEFAAKKMIPLLYQLQQLAAIEEEGSEANK